MKKKITHILYSGLGGHGSVVYSLIDGDKNKQLTHHLMFYGIESLTEDYRDKNIQGALRYDFIHKKKGIDVISLLKVYKALKKEKPDIILLHSMSLIIVSWAYSLLNNSNLICVEHTPNEVKTGFEWLWTRLSVLLSSKIVYLSGIYKEEIKQKLGSLFEKKKYVVNNGINIEQYTCPKREMYKEKINLIMTGRFSEQKDQKTIIRALKILEKEKIQLYLAGTGDNFVEAKKMVKEMRLQDKVHFLGYLNEKEIIKYLGKSDIYIQSSFGETMSTSIIQGMASGLPILATDIKGIKHMVNNDTGLFFQPKDAKHLSELIMKLYTDNNLRIKLGENGRSYAIERFSNVKMFNNYYSIIR